MTFNSFEFALLFFFCLAVYWRSNSRYRNHVLLGFSYVFYAWWDWRFLLLLVGITAVGYLTGRSIDASDQPGRRRLLLGVSAIANLGTLVVFRFTNFFVDEFGALVESVGLSGDSPAIDILIPIGVSFYTLQTLGYTIDVYRGRAPAERDFVIFATFIAFFPQLVAGPIERAQHLLPQLKRHRRRLHHADIELGLTLIALGLFKKIVLGDGVARVVDTFWADPGQASTAAAVAGVIGFSVQIYADFSGYSAIARGTAHLLGVDLTVNFRQPYLAHNISGFWRRWHISFSTWLRDYVYIPLGGNQRGRGRMVLALMVTMTVGGIWHGAGWMFLLWGVLHGVWLVAYHLTARPDAAPGRNRQLLTLAATYLGVTALWIVFRSPDAGTAVDVVQALLGGGGSVGDPGDLLLVAGAWITMIVIDIVHRRGTIEHALLEQRPVMVGVGAGLAAVALIVFSGAATVPFFYYQF